MAVLVAKKISRKTVDIIAAGPPCQGFSTLSKRNVNDPRNRLFKNLVKFVAEFKPKIFVMENVPGLLSMDGGKTIKKIKTEFEKQSYFVHVAKLSASDFGIPQRRTRVFVVGTSKQIPLNDLFPHKNGHATISVREAISDLDFLGVGKSSSKYKYKPESDYQKWLRGKSKSLYNHEAPRHSKKIQRRFSSMPKGSYGKHLKTFDSCKRDCFKFDPSRPSNTVTTLPEDFVHYKLARIPTVREIARLQSFPDSFRFMGPRTTGGSQRRLSCPQYTQVGNAVPPYLAEIFFRQMKKVIKKYYKGSKRGRN